jgi:murein DD-endopeptidase MepM/ murein hydrolase activator NlpD
MGSKRQAHTRIALDTQLGTAATASGWPVAAGRISSGFGWRIDPFSGRRARHNGVDIADRLGATISAIDAGQVAYSGAKPGYGLLVEINHGEVVTRYAHTRETLVTAGERVERGQPIARLGSSGRSTGPHLHFEVLKNGYPVNPSGYLTGF